MIFLILSLCLSSLPFPEKEMAPLFAEQESLCPQTDLKKPLSNLQLRELPTTYLSKHFSYELTLSPYEEGGYPFRIKLFPKKRFKEDLGTKQSPQLLSFILSAESKETFELMKEALAQAIGQMKTHSQFNIYLLQDRLYSFSSDHLFATKEQKEKARFFLQQAAYRPQKKSDQQFQSILERSDCQKLHTILFCGNRPPLSPKKIVQIDPKGPLSCSTFAFAKKGSDEEISLRLFSTLLRGNLSVNDKPSSFTRALCRGVKQLQRPFLIDSHICSLTEGVVLYNSLKYSPPLFLDKEVVLYGKMERLEPFELLIQGNVEKEIVHIQQTIYPRNSSIPSASIKPSLDQIRAFQCYIDFLEHKDLSKKVEAEKILLHYKQFLDLPKKKNR